MAALFVCIYVTQVGLVSHGGLCLQGASAGGWLAASVVLKQPQLFAAAVLTVPCLDPLGALLQCNQGGLELGAAATDPEVRFDHSYRGTVDFRLESRWW